MSIFDSDAIRRFQSSVISRTELLKYDGLILTTIKLDLPDGKKREDLEDGDEVSFITESGNAEEDAAFLKDIREDVVEGKEGTNLPLVGVTLGAERRIKATYVSNEEAAKIATEGYGGETKDHTTLFGIHGCCGNPTDILQLMPEAQKKFGKGKKCYLIPVIWPTRGGLLADRVWPGYYRDWDTFAPEAGGILAKLVNEIKNGSFGKISLMCHSMGNHLVLNNSGDEYPFAPDAEFQNIFMVGADVPSDIFCENPKQSRSKDDPEYKRKKAENMTKMLAKGGTIYVFHTNWDHALNGSMLAQWFRVGLARLGSSGANNIRKIFDGTVKNFDVSRNVLFASDRDDRVFNHLYQFEPWAVEFYSDVHSMNDAQLREKYEEKKLDWVFQPPLTKPTVDNNSGSNGSGCNIM